MGSPHPLRRQDFLRYGKTIRLGMLILPLWLLCRRGSCFFQPLEAESVKKEEIL